MKKNEIWLFENIIVLVIIFFTFISCGPPRLKGTVSIDGDPMLGKTITANTSSLQGSGIISFQWLKNGATIDGAINSTYVIQDSDKGANISVIVIRSDNSGSVISTDIIPYGYLIGDKGPGGGIIFYRNPDGFVMTDTREIVNYLEVAPENFYGLPWTSQQHINTNIPGTLAAIGSGRNNTALILAIDSNAPAALACKNYRYNGFNDWFLPSRNELGELFKQRTLVNISRGGFWTSSAGYGGYGAWIFEFDTRNWNSTNRRFGENVRAIRAF